MMIENDQQPVHHVPHPRGRKAGGRKRPRKTGYALARPPEPHTRGRKAPTPQERSFVEGVAQGKTDKQAALDAGYSFSMAENTKYKLWAKPQVQAYFQRILQTIAPPERILRNMSALIDGKFLTKKRRRTLDHAGRLVEQTIEETESVNPSTSLRATIAAAEWAGYVPSKRPEMAATLTQVQLRSNCKLAPLELSKGEADGGTGSHEPTEGAVLTEEAPGEGDHTGAKS